MPVFKDKNGKEWILKLDAPSIRDVRKQCQLDLADITGQSFERLRDDEVLLVDVLWVLCRSQAHGSTDAQFGEALVGDAIDAATKALREAMHDFFPKWKREALGEILAAGDGINAKRVEVTLGKLKDPEMMRKFEESLKQKLDEGFEKSLMQQTSVTNSPAPADSAPTDLPSPS